LIRRPFVIAHATALDPIVDSDEIIRVAGLAVLNDVLD
jgi:hypothetical protein